MASTQLIPIIIVSGEAGATTPSFCKELGATAYFAKPVDFEALRTGLADVLRTARLERRSELRIHLRAMLRLRGTDINKKVFEELSATENVSKTGFFCGCTAHLKNESTVEVYLVSGGEKHVGKARVVRSEGCDTPYPRYAFQLLKKDGDWILQ